MSRKGGKHRKGGKRDVRPDAGAPSAPSVERDREPVAPAPLELPATVSDAASPQPSRRPRPPGQRLYDMPFSALAPRLVNPALGMHQLVARAGHNAAYEIDVTLLDAPDLRLVRSGVLLAHRVLDGRGEWFLTAPDWQPLLPKDRIELMGHADLPEELADLIRPFRRRAHLGPVAALRCDRREFALRDEGGTTLALLRDDRVTVRRGGLTTARYREVMVTPLGPGLGEDQVAWLDRALLAAGSTLVPRFPRLVTRLGAPATAPTDFPAPGPFGPAASVKRFLGQLIGLRLRRIVESDLAVRGGDPEAGTLLVEQARLLRTELEGLQGLVTADWLGDLADELDWLLAESGAEPSRLPGRLRSERYLALLDRLVAATRAPGLGEAGGQPAAAALRDLLRTVVARLGTAAGAADLDAPGPAWAAVADAFQRCDAALALAGHLLPEETDVVTTRLAPARALLAAVCQQPRSAEEAQAQVVALTPEAAFAAGRAYERQVEEARRARAAFAKAWAKAERKLDRRLAAG